MRDLGKSKLDVSGLSWGFVSFALWGVFPFFWKLLADRSAPEILAHRMVWSFVFYLLVYLAISRRQLRELFSQTRRDWILAGLASAILALNWGIYIYAVNSGRILEGSLAYFINPILNVAAGVLFFKEPFPLILRLSVGFAALGVGARIALSTGFPWIALVLAFSFCAYGITKKLLKIQARTSSVLEGAVGLLPALVAVAYFRISAVEPLSVTTWSLLAAGGVVTGLPLFLFSYSAQRIPYSIIGLLQFVAPSLQFIIAVTWFGEAFGARDLASFGLIWVGILFYLAHQLVGRARSVKKRVPLSAMSP